MTIKHQGKNVSAEINKEELTTIEKQTTDNELDYLKLVSKNIHDNDDIGHSLDLLDFFYTKNQVDERIKLNIAVYNNKNDFPQTGKANYIYLAPVSIDEDNNPEFFREYIWTKLENENMGYKEIGTTELNLQPIMDKISNKVDKENGASQMTDTSTTFSNIGNLANKKQSTINQAIDTKLGTIPAPYVHPQTHPAIMITGLSAVATSGNYNDLQNKPTIANTVQDGNSNPVSSEAVYDAINELYSLITDLEEDMSL